MDFNLPTELDEATTRKVIAVARPLRQKALLAIAIVDGEISCERANAAFWEYADAALVAEDELASAVGLHLESSTDELEAFMDWQHNTLCRLLPGWSHQVAAAVNAMTALFHNYTPIALPAGTRDDLLDDKGLIAAMCRLSPPLRLWLGDSPE